jgi:hypothetical protein
MGRRLLGFAIVWVGIYGAMALGAVPGVSVTDRLMSLLVSLPAWGYIGFRVRREIRTIKVGSRLAGVRGTSLEERKHGSTEPQ